MPDKLPHDVKFITLKVPIYTGPVDRPTKFRMDYTLKGKEHSDVLHRLFLAHHNIDSENVSSYNRSFQLLLEAIRSKLPNSAK